MLLSLLLTDGVGSIFAYPCPRLTRMTPRARSDGRPCYWRCWRTTRWWHTGMHRQWSPALHASRRIWQVAAHGAKPYTHPNRSARHAACRRAETLRVVRHLGFTRTHGYTRTHIEIHSRIPRMCYGTVVSTPALSTCSIRLVCAQELRCFVFAASTGSGPLRHTTHLERNDAAAHACIFHSWILHFVFICYRLEHSNVR